MPSYIDQEVYSIQRFSAASPAGLGLGVQEIIIGVAGHQIGVPEPLFRSITDEEVNSLRQRFIGSQAERAAAAAAALAGASLVGKVQLNVLVPDCIAAQDFVHCCVSLMAQEAFTVLLG